MTSSAVNWPGGSTTAATPTRPISRRSTNGTAGTSPPRAEQEKVTIAGCFRRLPITGTRITDEAHAACRPGPAETTGACQMESAVPNRFGTALLKQLTMRQSHTSPKNLVCHQMCARVLTSLSLALPVVATRCHRLPDVAGRRHTMPYRAVSEQGARSFPLPIETSFLRSD